MRSGIKRAVTSRVFANGFWGVGSSILQTVLASLIFIILARNYSAISFAHYLLAQSVYQLITSISSMGLSQWFVRMFDDEIDKPGFTMEFFFLQLRLGVYFYLLNIVIAYLLYSNTSVRFLSIIVGANVIIDNIFYAFKTVNIKLNSQVKTFRVLGVDSGLRLVTCCLLYVHPVSLELISFAVLMVRLVSLNSIFRSDIFKFIKFRWSELLASGLASPRIPLLRNWRFILIGAISILYWRAGNFIIARYSSLEDVSSFEIAFRIFSIQLLVPVAVFATIYPQFVSLYNEKRVAEFRNLYKRMYILCFSFSFLTYFFVYVFADEIVSIFGTEYSGAAIVMREMFLTTLVFPMVLLQANVLLAMKLESLDLLFNVISFFLYLALCFVGIMFYPSVSVVCYSVFASFFVFYIMQEVVLIRSKMSNSLIVVVISLFGLILTFAFRQFSSFFSPVLALLSFGFALVVGSGLLIVNVDKLKFGEAKARV